MRPKIFFDTNVLLDVLLGDRPSSRASTLLFEAVRQGLLEGFMTTQSLLDASYVFGKAGTGNREAFCRHLLYLLKLFNVDALTGFDIQRACLSGSGDLEDEAQYSRATDRCCHVVVTSDKRFREAHADNAGICFLSPEQLLREMQGEA